MLSRRFALVVTQAICLCLVVPALGRTSEPEPSSLGAERESLLSEQGEKANSLSDELLVLANLAETLERDAADEAQRTFLMAGSAQLTSFAKGGTGHLYERWPSTRSIAIIGTLPEEGG